MAKIYMDETGDTLIEVVGRCCFTTEDGDPVSHGYWWAPDTSLARNTLIAAVPDQKALEMREKGLSWWEVLHLGR